MQQFDINGNSYELIEDDNCFSIEQVRDYLTGFFEPFDYILGDYSGDKIRLKGFYESSHKNVKKYNDIKYLDFYKKNYCNIGAKTFLLKKLQKK